MSVKQFSPALGVPDPTSVYKGSTDSHELDKGSNILPADLDPHLKSVHVMFCFLYFCKKKSPCSPYYEKALFLIEKEMGNTEKYEVNENSFPK